MPLRVTVRSLSTLRRMIAKILTQVFWRATKQGEVSEVALQGDAAGAVSRSRCSRRTASPGCSPRTTSRSTSLPGPSPARTDGRSRSEVASRSTPSSGGPASDARWSSAARPRRGAGRSRSAPTRRTLASRSQTVINIDSVCFPCIGSPNCIGATWIAPHLFCSQINANIGAAAILHKRKVSPLLEFFADLIKELFVGFRVFLE